MDGNVAEALAALQNMGPTELRAKYQEVYGESVRTGNRAFLIKRIAWRLQSRAEGDISQRARARAAELAQGSDIRTTLPRLPRVVGEAPTVRLATAPQPSRLPMANTLLTRQYKGRTVEVLVRPDGRFQYEGQVYRSLTAVTQVITGSHWNGYQFFNVQTHEGRSA